MDDWSIGYLWRWTNLLERFWLTALALLLLYAIVVVVRFAKGYQFVRRFGGYKDRESPCAENKIATAMRLDVKGLRLVSETAPFVGLAGMCSGILTVFRGYVGTRQGFMVMTTSILAAALIATAAGILVAVPATCLYYYLRERLEKLELAIPSSGLRARCSNLSAGWAEEQRFSALPPFALLAAPCVATFIIVSMMFTSFHRQEGLSVYLMKPGPYTEHLVVEPIIIGVQGAGKNGPTVYVNSQKTPWDKLEKELLRDARLRPHSPVYVRAQNDASWQDLVNVIDVLEGLHAHVVLLAAVYGGPAAGVSTPLPY